MLFHRRRKIFANKRAVAIVFLTALFVLLFVLRVSFPESITRMAYAFGEPFWRAQPALRAEVSGILKLFGTKGEIVSENRWLVEELERARLSLFDYKTIIEENRRLREILEINTETDRIVAGVLLHPSVSPYDIFVVDVGTDDGVKNGDRVFASDKVFLGFIEQTQNTTSRVRLISSPGMETDVVLEDSDVTLNATGRGGGNISLDVPRGIDVFVGESIFVPGIQSLYVGSVSIVEFHPADAVQKVLFRLPINIHTIREVFIETDNV